MVIRVYFRMCERGHTPRTARLFIQSRIKKIAGGSRGACGNAAKLMSFFRFSGLSGGKKFERFVHSSK